jgi:hypothetical protein
MTDDRINPYGIKHTCCSAFERAKEVGTDNEGYEPLVFLSSGAENDPMAAPEGEITIGTNLPTIRFCPWCGTPVMQQVKAGG